MIKRKTNIIKECVIKHMVNELITKKNRLPKSATYNVVVPVNVMQFVINLSYLGKISHFILDKMGNISKKE